MRRTGRIGRVRYVSAERWILAQCLELGKGQTDRVTSAAYAVEQCATASPFLLHRFTSNAEWWNYIPDFCNCLTSNRDSTSETLKIVFLCRQEGTANWMEVYLIG